MRTGQCVDQRLDDLGALLDRAAAGHRLPPTAAFGRVRQPIVASTTWSSVIASPVMAQLQRDELAKLRAAYTYVATMDAIAQDEKRAWDTLWMMVGPGRDLSPVEEVTLRQALISARSNNILMGLNGVRLMEQVEALDLPFTADQKNTLAKRVHQPLQEVDLTFVCTPHPEGPPSHYGQSSSSSFLPVVNAALDAGVRLGPPNR
jgi:hypothetical protein